MATGSRSKLKNLIRQFPPSVRWELLCKVSDFYLLRFSPKARQKNGGTGKKIIRIIIIITRTVPRTVLRLPAIRFPLLPILNIRTVETQAHMPLQYYKLFSINTLGVKLQQLRFSNIVL